MTNILNAMPHRIALYHIGTVLAMHLTAHGLEQVSSESPLNNWNTVQLLGTREQIR